MTSSRIFISYSRADMSQVDWLERLRLYLSQARRIDGLDVWDDSRLEVGTRWKDEIEHALESSSAAVLLVGPGFLGSSFVNEVELPRILERNKKRGIGFFPVVVGYCQYARSSLSPYQSFNDPEVPLEKLPEPEQNRWLNKVATAVSEHVRSQPGAMQSRSSVWSSDALHELVMALQKTRTAFRAQVKRSDELVAQMRRRLGIEGDFQYERFFVRYFQQMDDDDQFLFQQIRAITQGPMRDGKRGSPGNSRASPAVARPLPTPCGTSTASGVLVKQIRSGVQRAPRHVSCVRGSRGRCGLSSRASR